MMQASSLSLEQNPDYICCGHFGKTVGLKGQIRFYPSSGQLDTLLHLSAFYLLDMTKLVVQSFSSRKDFIVFSFEKFQSLEEVSSLVNQKLYLEKKDLPTLEDHEFYWYQLINLDVVNLQKQSLGKVEKLYSNGVQDVLCTSSGAQIPFLREIFVKDVCLLKKLIIVDFSPTYDEVK
jgi:16S rRNA processing protein RimM